MRELSIIIVNFNTAALCRAALDAVRRTTRQVDWEAVVVDNSTDPAQLYADSDPRVRVLGGVENHGFGHACNLGLRQAQGRYVLFLNSDTQVGEGALDRSVAYLQAHPQVGALGIRTLLPDGSFDHGCKRGFPTPANALWYFLGMDRRHPHSRRFGGYRLTYLPQEETNLVDAVSGAFLLAPLPLLRELGGFDETFFMYGEDLDLCYRIKALGYQVVYYAGAQMVHYKGQSGLCSQNPVVIRHFYRAMTLFYEKHYQKKYPFFVGWAVHFAVWGKQRLALRGSGQ